MRALIRAIRRRSGRDDERGASLVEFALVVPLFVLLLFALVDFGLVFGGYITLRSDVSSAARQLSVDNVPAGCAGYADPFNCTVQQEIGSLPGMTGTPNVAIAFPASGAGVGGSVAVCVTTDLRSTTGLLKPILDPRTVTVKTEVRLEQNPTQTASSIPAGMTCAA